MDSSDWSNGIRYQAFDFRPDTDFNATGYSVIERNCRLGVSVVRSKRALLGRSYELDPHGYVYQVRLDVRRAYGLVGPTWWYCV
jgi:hypothetical protein